MNDGTVSLEQWERDSQYVTQLRAENAELKQQRDELLWKLEWHIDEIKLLNRHIDELNARKFGRFGNEDCWIYQGAGEDHLESLVCPVVISPSRLIELIKQRDELLTALEKFMDAHEECTDFDGYTAHIVSMDDYHEAQDTIASVKGGA